MKAKDLKKGDAVVLTLALGSSKHAATFVWKNDHDCYFQVPDFVGLNGPEDKGICAMPIREVPRKVSRPPAEAPAPKFTPVSLPNPDGYGGDIPVGTTTYYGKETENAD